MQRSNAGNMMPKVVLSAYFGFGNFGDEAILSVLLDKLKEADVTVISRGGAVDTFDFWAVIRAIWASDILISGGGSLLQDMTSIKSLLYYCWVIFTALVFRKKVIIFAQGIGPLNCGFMRVIVKNLLKHCAYISVRDEDSLNLLKSWDIQADLVCDPVFEMALPDAKPKPVVGIQLRGFKNLTDEFLQDLASAVKEEFSNKQIKIISLQDSIDLEVCERFQEFLLGAEIVSGLSVEAVIEEISRLEYLIAMRFHALLIARRMGIKTLAINYDPKVERFAADFGLPIISMENPDWSVLEVLRAQKKLSITDKCFDWSGLEKILTKSLVQASIQ